MASIENFNLRIWAAGKTDCGLMRSENEDSFYLNLQRGIYAVADGLGGLPHGALASKTAIDAVDEYLRSPSVNGTVDYAALFDFANECVQQKARELGEEIGIGTTLTLAHITQSQLRIAHAGDTGVFLFKNAQWAQLTIDHTMAQEMRDRLGPNDNSYIPDYYNHTLTRCIGQPENFKTDIYAQDLAAGDRLLLYTDGVTKVFDHDELAQKVAESTDPEVLVESLILDGNERGGPDNITAIALFCEPA